MPEPSAGSRSTWLPVLLGVCGAALTAVAAAKPWASAGRAAESLSAAGLSGAGEEPLGLALALVALAAWGALLVTRGRFRVVIAGLGLLAAAGVVATALVEGGPVQDSVRTAVSDHLALSPKAAAAIDVGLTGWYWVSLLAAVVTVVAFALALRAIDRIPSMGGRYDAPGTLAQRARTEPRTQTEIWKALDEGVDPTEEPRP